MNTNLHPSRPASKRDPIDRLSAPEFAALLDAMAGRPIRRRSKHALTLDPSPALAHVGAALGAYPDRQAAA